MLAPKARSGMRLRSPTRSKMGSTPTATKTSSLFRVKAVRRQHTSTPITWQTCLFCPLRNPSYDLGAMQYNSSMTDSHKQPNSRMCFICGLENPVGLHLHIYETEPGVVETTYIAPEHFQGYPGVLHGGIVGAIIDEIAGRSHMGSDP